MAAHRPAAVGACPNAASAADQGASHALMPTASPSENAPGAILLG